MAMTVGEVERVSEKDPELCSVRYCIQSGDSMENTSLPEREERALHNREVSHAWNKDRYPSEPQK